VWDTNKNDLAFTNLLRCSKTARIWRAVFSRLRTIRVLPQWGPFLRKSKINELPQLLNIFLGDMSFVGPRPVMPISFAAYPENIQQTIYDVKPGLTGIGSIVFRDEEALIAGVKEKGEDAWAFYENELYPFKGKLEQWYQANQSFSTDFKIILLTAIVIARPHSDVVNNWFPTLPKRNF
jgi:lipopolysaccharide/colanic/teichoic acid biosynthesis glycosyltransferase